jgi:hypothetical protein
MIITEVEARLGVTVNIGNFESVRLDYQVRAQLEEGESATEAIDKSRNWLRDKIAKDLVASNGGKDLLKKK